MERTYDVTLSVTITVKGAATVEDAIRATEALQGHRWRTGTSGQWALVTVVWTDAIHQWVVKEVR